MHCNTLNPYLKNIYKECESPICKENTYNCLYIGNLKKIAYYNYIYYVDVYLHRGTSKIPNVDTVNLIINKDLTVIRILVYGENFKFSYYYEK